MAYMDYCIHLDNKHEVRQYQRPIANVDDTVAQSIIAKLVRYFDSIFYLWQYMEN